jgi:XRE family transcriptional regulator, fatty acid utilization regulator
MTESIRRRIREERDRAGLSQDELAKRAGLPARQTVTDIENGNREVKAWELVKIASVLGLDMNTFLSETEKPSDHSYVLWRQLPSADVRQQLENRFFKKCEAYALVERLSGNAQLDKKPLPHVPIDIGQTSFWKVFDLADRVRLRFGLGERPGCALMQTLEEEYAVKIFLCSLERACSAAAAKGTFGTAILLNGDEPVWRRNYSCAHELFHLITWDESLFDKIRHDPALEKKNETLADVFSAGLLMPGDQVKIDINQIVEENKIKAADVVSLAMKYGVSTIAFLWRLHNLKLLPEGTTVEGLQQDQAFQEIDRDLRSRQQQNHQEFPERFIRFVFQSVSHGKLSRSKAADMLDQSLVDLPEFFRSAGFIEPEDDDIEVSAA